MTSPPQTPFSLVPYKAGLLSFPGISAESAHTTTELLQRNHADYHGFFSDLGEPPSAPLPSYAHR